MVMLYILYKSEPLYSFVHFASNGDDKSKPAYDKYMWDSHAFYLKCTKSKSME